MPERAERRKLALTRSSANCYLGYEKRNAKRKRQHEIRGNEHAATVARRKIREAPQDEVLIMKAVKDEEGEMVATDVISAAMVTARFRNVAERHGKVDLRFRIIVPATMRDSKWQLRFFPDLYMLGDTVSLDPVIITGLDYRRAQLRGY
jgi:hypothetical protein